MLIIIWNNLERNKGMILSIYQWDIRKKCKWNVVFLVNIVPSISSKIKNRLWDHPYDFIYTKTAHAQATHYCTAFNVLRLAAFQLPPLKWCNIFTKLIVADRKAMLLIEGQLKFESNTSATLKKINKWINKRKICIIDINVSLVKFDVYFDKKYFFHAFLLNY